MANVETGEKTEEPWPQCILLNMLNMLNMLFSTSSETFHQSFFVAASRNFIPNKSLGREGETPVVKTDLKIDSKIGRKHSYDRFWNAAKM